MPYALRQAAFLNLFQLRRVKRVELISPAPLWNGVACRRWEFYRRPGFGGRSLWSRNVLPRCPESVNLPRTRCPSEVSCGKTSRDASVRKGGSPKNRAPACPDFGSTPITSRESRNAADRSGCRGHLGQVQIHPIGIPDQMAGEVALLCCPSCRLEQHGKFEPCGQESEKFFYSNRETLATHLTSWNSGKASAGRIS
jgi:hypothetical protein